MKTLADLAKEYDVTPQAIAKWRDKAIEHHGELEFIQQGKKKLYGLDEVDKIIAFAPNPEGPITTETEILTGNHRVTGQLATMPTTVDLGNMRQGADLTVFSGDALAAVDQALDLADQMLDAIEDDTTYQLGQLQRTQQANAKLQRKVQQLNLRKQQYQTESKLIAIAQGKEVSELKENMDTLQSLGNSEG